MICLWVPKEREAKEKQKETARLGELPPQGTLLLSWQPGGGWARPRGSGGCLPGQPAHAEDTELHWWKTLAGNRDVYFRREMLLLLAGHKLYMRIWLVWKIPLVFLELYSGALHKTHNWVWFCMLLLSLSESRLGLSLQLNPDQVMKSNELESQFICACMKLKQHYWLCWYFSETRFWPLHNQIFTFLGREQVFLFSFFPLSK